ncbi:MAG: hypothetical protein J7L61_03395, partial [Thermoplasmata archaeon]|nr:hypothetical protein [Thermoplasmata archaeon]
MSPRKSSRNDGEGVWDVRLLSATYRREKDEEGEERPLIELYGVTRGGKSVVVLYRGFRPYFYVCEPEKGLLRTLEEDKGVEGMEETSLWVDGMERRCWKVVVKHPWDVPSYRARAADRCYKVLAADIPFGHRFIYDMGIGSSFRVRGREVSSGEMSAEYHVDLVILASGFEDMEDIKPPLGVFSFDIENSIDSGEIFTICYVHRGRDGERTEGCISGGEREILEGFVSLVLRLDPDIITGYNIDNYDLPHLEKRCEVHGLSLGIGRDGSTPARVNNQFWRVKGRVVADAWWNAKVYLRPKKETLNHLAMLLLGEEKLDVDRRKMDEEWAGNPERVKEYCLKDAELALGILDKIGAVERNLDLASVSMLPLDDVLNGRTSVMIDSILIRAADERGIGVPMNRYGRGGKRIEGGYVHAIKPGLYDWVCVLDFKSMYPSIIISNNICMTTLSPQGTIESPSGARFLAPEVKKGLVPSLLEELMERREEAKARMKNASTEEERWYYDGLQNAIKVLMNSFYGVFASSFYRFTNKDIGSAITSFARSNVKSIIASLEDEGIRVIYGDTDSVFFQSPIGELEGAVAFGQEVAEKFSKRGMVLEFEKLLNPLFSHGKKKRYAGKVVWPEEDIIIRGYEIRRTDSFDFQSEALMEVFQRIFERDTEGAVSRARELVEMTRRGEVPVEKLVISRTCRDFRAYKDPDTQATVQTAKKLKERGYEFTPGMKVSWIVVDSRRRPQHVEPWIDGEPFERTPDYQYYAERVASTLARVTEVFGVDEKDLLFGHSQRTLFGGWDTGGKREGKGKREGGDGGGREAEGSGEKEGKSGMKEESDEKGGGKG